MICRAIKMTVSMWNTTPGWNGLNKRESFMTVIIKANTIHIWLSKGLSKAQGWEGAYKRVYVGVREMKLAKRV